MPTALLSATYLLSCRYHARCCTMPQFTGLMLPMLSYGHSQYYTLPIYSIEFLGKTLDAAPSNCSVARRGATSKFQDFHVWGCPVYVLGSALSGGRSIPRWKPRLSRGMYVGHSIKFGHSVPLVLDLDTGSITGQFHVVFDDWFQTVPSTSNTKVNFNHNDWYKTFGLTEWQYTPDDDNEDANTATIPVPETTSSGAMHQEYLRAARNHVQPPQPVSLLDDKQRETVQRETVPTPPPTPSSPPPLSSMPLSALNEATAPDASLQREKTHTSDAAETTPPASRQDEVTLTQDSHATSNSVGQHI